VATIYFDLSEQFLANGHRFKYYGIVRTVMEVGYEMARDADVRFVIFSPAHGSFFQVTPRFDDASPTGIMDPGLPPEATPIRLRQSYPRRNVLRDALAVPVQAVIRQINLRRWRHVPKGAVRPVDMTGQILIALGRPKIMSDYLTETGRAGKAPCMVPLLHDMFPLHGFAHRDGKIFTNNFTYDNALLISHAGLIITNSQFTHGEVMHFAGKGLLPDLPPVVAVPLAHELRTTDEPVQMAVPEQSYVICVGTLTGRKNLECVLDALMQLHSKSAVVPDLVLAGARRKRTEEYVAQDRFAPLQGKIHFKRDPNQSELRALYKGARALIIPSYMEGWGLPLGEAMWVGTPGLSSTAPALREVGGDLAQYFAPDDPDALAQLMETLMSDEAGYQAQRKRVHAARAQLRSWQHVAQDILHAVRAHLSVGRSDG
jgi:glycosyltransferase involved in cell wall biosynthesis